MTSLLGQNVILMWMILLISADPKVCEQCSCYGNRIDCSERRLTAVPSSWPNSTVWIDLSHNQIIFVGPQAFLGLSDLIHLDLSWNAIANLSEGAFIGLSELLHLNLNENPLPYASGLTDGVFTPLVKLKELYLLTDDCPTQPPDRYVQGLRTLETLAIVATKQGRIGENLGLLRSLDTLMLTSRECEVSRFDERDTLTLAHLPLRRLSLRNSRLRALDPAFLTYFNRTLTKLDLSCNSLDTLPSIIETLRGTRLDTLLLDAATDNFLPVEMNADFFSALSSTPLRILSVARNLYLQMDISENVSSYRMPHLRYLRLGYNQLVLNSKQTKENAILASMILLFNVSVLDINGLFSFNGRYDVGQNDSLCRELDPLFSDERQAWEDDQLRYPPPDSFLIWLLAAAFRLAFHNELTLPPMITRLYAAELGGYFDKFSCHQRKIYFKNNLRIANLSRAAINDLECDDSGLSSVTEFHVDHVGLEAFNPSYFSLGSMPMLSTLDLSENKLGSFIDSRVSGSAFTGMSGIQHLDMSANGITIMQAEVLSGLENVTLMNFSRNSICTWNATIASLNQLRILDISSNQLTTISENALSEFEAHAAKVPDFAVDMSSNPFVCSCDNADLFKWLIDTSIVHNVKSCSDGSTAKLLNAQLLLELWWRCSGMRVVIVVLSVLSALLVPAVLSYACKWRIRYMYYRFRRLCRREDRSWLVDTVGVYVSFHESDVKVASKLCAYLKSRVEHAKIVTRQAVELGKYELEQMADLVDECNVTVILISPDSLSDSKFEFEFYMALEKGLHSILPIITTESFEFTCLPPKLLKLLISNSYLRLPGGLSHGDNHESEEVIDPRWKEFLIICESTLMNIIERQAIRKLQKKPVRARQQSNVAGSLTSDEERPLLA